MSSEIEKLHKNAGVEQIGFKRCSGIKQSICQHNCDECEDYVRHYPPFTAEKQLELIKWLLQNKRLCIRKAECSNNFYMDVLSNRADGVDNKDLEQCLASLVSNIWQSLTDTEKQQLKEILDR